MCLSEVKRERRKEREEEKGQEREWNIYVFSASVGSIE